MVRRLIKKIVSRKPRISPPHRAPAHKKSDLHLRVMTYNIHHGRGMDKRYDLERIAQVIREVNPDVVALQEIEQFRLRTKRHNQPEILAKLLGMEYAFARVCEFGRPDAHRRGAYGIAILSRHPIVAQEHFDLSFSGATEQRGCLHATIRVQGCKVHVFCVHLGLRYRERHFQVARLLSEDIVNNEKFGNGPKLLLGDFNNWWPVKSAKQVEVHFHNACVATGRKRLRTFGRFFNYLCLDYIYTSPDLNIVSCEVINSTVAKVASDHRPVACTVEVACEPARRELHPPQHHLAKTA